MVKELLQKNSSNRAQPRRIRSPNRQPSGLTVCVLVALLALSMIPTIQAQQNFAPECIEYLPSTTTCVRCREGYGLVKGMPTPTCIDIPTIFTKTYTDLSAPPGSPSTAYGYDYLIDAYRPCKSSGCQYCFNDFAVCNPSGKLVCSPGWMYRFSNGVVECIYIQEFFPEGYGPYSSEWELPCLFSGCLTCNQNYKVCSSCKTTPVKYYSLSGGACVLPNDNDLRGTRYGYSPSTDSLVPCDNPLCMTCGSYFGTCSLCDPMTVNIKGHCYGYWVLPTSTYGTTVSRSIDPVTQPCSIENCKVCYLNSGVSSCYLCKNSVTDVGSADFFNHPTTGQCVDAAGLPDGYGPDIDSKFILPCKDSNCKRCHLDYTMCEQCNPLYYQVENAKFCVKLDTKSFGLPYFGINAVKSQSTPPELVLSICELGCISCATTHKTCDTVVYQTTCTAIQFCTSCLKTMPTSVCNSCGKDPNNIQRYPQIGNPMTCMAKTSTLQNQPRGPLITTNVNVVMPCLDSKCAKCSVIYNTCEECSPPYILSNGRCTANLPASKGFTAINGGSLAGCTTTWCTSCRASTNAKCDLPCTDSNCLRCSAAPGTCEECKIASDPSQQTYVYQGKCILVKDFPTLTGINLAYPRKVVQCADSSSCTKCTYDASKCEKCALNANREEYPKFNGVCVRVEPRQGIDTTDGSIKSCQDPKCMLCTYDYTICKKCDAGTGFFLGVDPITGKAQCQSATGTPSFPDQMGPDSTTGTVLRCSVRTCLLCPMSYKFCTKCKPDYYLKEIPSGTPQECLNYDNIPSTFGILLSSVSIPKLGKCKNSRCMKCSPDTNQCENCSTGLLADIVNGLCLTQLQFTAKPAYGKVVENSLNQVRACEHGSACLQCRDDYTKCTQCAASYFLEPISSKCYLQIEFPPQFGKVRTTTGALTNTIAACTDSLCKTCTEDNTKCNGCLEVTQFHDSTNFKCYAEIPTGFGLNLDSTYNEILPCVPSLNCQNCQNSYKECTSCTGDYYFDLELKSCTFKDSIVNGKGKVKNAETQQIRSCQAKDTCLSCKEDYTFCTECKDRLYLSVVDNVCYQLDSLPPRMGKITPPVGSTFKSIQKCQVENCETCLEDYTKCTMCRGIMYLDTTNNVCSFSLKTGYGLNIKSLVNEILPCKNPLCVECRRDYTVCELCQKTSYFDINDNTCYESIPSGKGQFTDTVLRDVLHCQDSENCLKCSSNFVLCEVCKDGFYVDILTSECVSKSTMNKKMGVDKSAAVGTVRPCKDPTCYDCTDDYEGCTQCNFGYIFAPSTGKCYLITDTFPEGTGVKTDEKGVKSIQPCEEDRCLACRDDYSVCTKCKIEYELSLKGKCQDKPTPSHVLPIPSFKKDETKFTIPLPGKKITQNIVDQLQAIVKISSRFYYNDQRYFDIKPESYGISVTVTIDEEFGKADLIVDRKSVISSTSPSSTSTSPTRVLSTSLTPEEQATLDSLSLPMTGPIISNYRSSALSALASFEVYTKIAIALRIIGNVVLPADPHSRAAAFAMDRVFSHLTLAGVQGSESYVMSRMAVKVVEQNRRTVIPFLNFDDLQRERYPPGCRPTNNMLVAGVDCDFIFNYGSNSIGFLILLFFMVVIDLFYFFKYSKPKVNENHFYFQSVSHLFFLAVKAFGVRFFLAKMDGIFMELMFYETINLYTLKGYNGGPFIFGLVFLVYFIAQIIACITVARKLIPVMRRLEPDVATGKDIATICAERHAVKGYLWRITSVMWEGMRAELGIHGVIFPIVGMMRMLLLGLLVGLLTDGPVAMCVLVIITEVLYLVYATLFTRLSPRMSGTENFLEFIGPAFNLVYYFFAAVSFAPSARRTESFDTYLFALLTIFYLLYLIVTAISIILVMIKFARWLLAIRQPQKGYHRPAHLDCPTPASFTRARPTPSATTSGAATPVRFTVKNPKILDLQKAPVVRPPDPNLYPRLTSINEVQIDQSPYPAQWEIHIDIED
jgi:hypothetical protein